MKIEDVPQDLGYFKDTVVRDVIYGIDKNGNYQSVISDGWEVKNAALDLTWDTVGEECEKIRAQVLAREISPLAYYMEKNLMEIGLLSGYTGISRRNIKKHLEPGAFDALSEEVLQQYAEALRITVEELKKV
ncbi:MAG: hypothetical protein LBR52_05085 [Prevotellaceae bacterium]|jgi:hypothetical protein|nr:hypothetical protein [Prevotellaceae bacterium]